MGKISIKNKENESNENEEDESNEMWSRMKNEK
jgi:hypothetical protein